jgi:hypothetical protein
MSAAVMEVRVMEVRDIVALLGRLRPILPPGGFLADVVVAGVLALSAPPFFRGGFPLMEPWEIMSSRSMMSGWNLENLEIWKM